uniref:zinc finger protein ZFP2-like n=1 Tax=Myxine glutinosa TaxID=7769 RepID=UPI0035900615
MVPEKGQHLLCREKWPLKVMAAAQDEGSEASLAWLQAQGLRAETARIVVTELGIKILGVLRACSGPTSTTATKLLSLARQKLPLSVFTEFRCFVETQWATRDDESSSEAVSVQTGDPKASAGLPGTRDASRYGHKSSSPSSSDSSGDDVHSGTTGSCVVEDQSSWEAWSCADDDEQYVAEIKKVTNSIHTKSGVAGTLISKNTCVMCQEEFSTEDLLHLHLETHDHKPKQKKHKCNLCPYSSGRKDNFIAHLRIHTGERPYTCSVCEKAFSSSSACQKHMRIHTGERPYKCTTCGKAFAQSTSCQTHMRIHTGERPHKCATCGKTFAHQTAYQKHVRIHTGERPYKCSYCEKGFPSSSDCQKHMRTHTGERPYKCAVCGKAFAQSTGCQTHMRIHSTERFPMERPHKCTTCGKTFAHSATCRIHMRIHTGERPYNCTFCNKAFSCSSDCQRHVRTHTGERPYKCPSCGKDFTRSAHCQRHMRIHVRETSFLDLDDDLNVPPQENN